MRKQGLLLSIGISLISLLAVLSAPQSAQEARVKLVAGFPGGSLEAADRLVIAMPVINEGKREAQNVLIRGISLEGAPLITPEKLPIDLGSIRAGERATVFATFGKGPFTPAKTYLLKVEGTFRQGRQEYKFAVEHPLRLPPASPGRAKAISSSSIPKKVKGAPYPAHPPHFPNEVNTPSKWTVPTGTYHAPEPRSKESGTKRAPEGRNHHPVTNPQGISFFTNASLGISGRDVNEPSGAVGGGVVFASANAFAAYSTNNGGSFTQLNPTTIFPNDLGIFCCDQVVVYVQSIDRIIWLLQYSDGYRLAAASPANVRSSGGTMWTYWDITAAQLGYGGGLDFPDMSIGDNSLYVDFDQGPGLVVVRIPLVEIQTGSTINFWYTDPNNSTMAYFGQLTQNPRDEIFWAGHNSNSSMRVFSWPEASTNYSWRDVGIGSWPNNNAANMSSLTPDSQDWLSMLRSDNDNFIQGSTRVFSTSGNKVNQIWFAWTAPSGDGFPQAHVQWVALDRNNNFNLVTQQQIWNPSYAFAYPTLAVNSNNEVGLSLEYGGGGNFENHVVGFWGDFIVYITTSSNLGVNRFGDYVTIRQDASNPERFDAFGYGMMAAPSRSDTHYVVFGR